MRKKILNALANGWKEANNEYLQVNSETLKDILRDIQYALCLSDEEAEYLENKVNR